jgi:antirestriction protein
MITFSDVMEEVPSHLTGQEDAVQAFWDNQPGYWETITVKEFWEEFEGQYRGTWESELEFGEELAEDLVIDNELLRSYFDYEMFTNDLFMGDYWSKDVTSGVAIFSSY